MMILMMILMMMMIRMMIRMNEEYSEDDMGKCNGYDENTSSSFKRKMKEWKKLAYISKMNERSFVPSQKIQTKNNK